MHRFDKHFLDHEVVKTGQYRDHQIDDVLDRCFVMFITRFNRGRPRGFPTDKEVYVCESRYNEERFTFNKIKTWAGCVPDEVRDKDYEMDLFDVPRVLRKIPSPIKHLLRDDARETDDLPKPTWGSPNAPPIVGAVHRRPREYNVSQPAPRCLDERILTWSSHFSGVTASRAFTPSRICRADVRPAARSQPPAVHALTCRRTWRPGPRHAYTCRLRTRFGPVAFHVPIPSAHELPISTGHARTRNASRKPRTYAHRPAASTSCFPNANATDAVSSTSLCPPIPQFQSATRTPAASSAHADSSDL